MRKNFGAKTILYPMPVLIIGTFGPDGEANAMNAAWGGISEAEEISISIDKGHKTAANLASCTGFTVSFADEKNIVACDYVGIVSANKEPDKLRKTDWHITRSTFVDAPLFDELPVALECELVSYDPHTSRLVGKIVNVSADTEVLDENGKIDMDKFKPVTFDPVHHTYRRLGDIVGMAFSDGKMLK